MNLRNNRAGRFVYDAVILASEADPSVIPCHVCVKNAFKGAKRRMDFYYWFGFICTDCQNPEYQWRRAKDSFGTNVDTDCILYFVHAVGTDRYKFGVTQSLEMRLKSLSNSSPYPVTLLYSMKGSRFLEQRLFRFYIASRLHGEWFQFADIQPILDQLTIIKKLKSARYRFDELQPL